MPRAPLPRSSQRPRRRHNPLADDLSHIGSLSNKSIIPSTGKRKSRSDEENRDSYIDASSSRKILAIARDLAEEDRIEAIQQGTLALSGHAFAIDSRVAEDAAVSGQDGPDQYDDNEEENWMPDEDVQDEDIDPGDLAVYNRLLPPGDDVDVFAPSLAALSTSLQLEGSLVKEPEDEGNTAEQSVNLADLILQRIYEKEAFQSSQSHLQASANGSAAPSSSDVPPKVVEVFTKCGELLSRYKSGPLPKPFKILPTLPAWPDILLITHPETWTPNAVFAATKIFVSAPPDTAQHFLNTVLLDRVKEDISETRKLNVHLYDALKKALYKPAAFFKGLLFPLVMDGCTLREAKILSSVLVRVSIPVLHSAAALLRLCEVAAEKSTNVGAESAGACNIFIRALLEKKYALPYKAVDALVFYFLRFRNSKNVDETDANGHLLVKKNGSRKAGASSRLPVLWHQSLLIFAQRYKNDITEDQREALLDLLLLQGHNEIGPEVRRELLAGRARAMQESGGQQDQGANHTGRVGDDGDDTMIGIVT